MGKEVAAQSYTREERQRYREKVRQDLDVFERMLAERAFDFVNFTGSVRGGQKIERAAAGTFVGLGLERGGKDPGYVAEDADPGAAEDERGDPVGKEQDEAGEDRPQEPVGAPAEGGRGREEDEHEVEAALEGVPAPGECRILEEGPPAGRRRARPWARGVPATERGRRAVRL